MINFWFLLDRVKEKWFAFYRKKVFLARIGSGNQSIKILGCVSVRATNIKIGNNVTIYPGVMFWGDGKIVIGNNVNIGKDTIIFAKKSVTIGDDTIIAAQCYIIDGNHGISKSTLIREQPLQVDVQGIRIGRDVWLSAGCKVLRGALIHSGAVIGAMSLVNSEIASNGVAWGIPARVVKFRE